MANQNQNGGRGVVLPPEHRPIWSPEEQAQPRIYRNHSSYDDRDYRSWRERSYLDEDRYAEERDLRLWSSRQSPELGALDHGERRSTYERPASQGGSSHRGEPIGHRSETSCVSYAGYGVSRGTGPHRGKGPVGYRRSDERIRELVCEVLTEDDQLDASRIEVSVSNGEVVLSGVVDDNRAKREAEDCACSAMGVRDVRNLLRLKNEPPPLKPTQVARPAQPLSAKSQAQTPWNDKKPRM